MASTRNVSLSKSGRGELNRRVALGAIVGVPCLAVGLRAALAEAATSGKPVLTEASFNALVQERSRSDHGRAVASEMGRDFRGFVRSHFTLTPVQEQRVAAIPSSALSELQSAFARVSASGGAMTISFQEPRSHGVKPMKKIQMHFGSANAPTTVTWSTA